MNFELVNRQIYNRIIENVDYTNYNYVLSMNETVFSLNYSESYKTFILANHESK